MHGRIEADKQVVYLMIDIYCRGRHRSARSAGGALCPECAALLAYAHQRLDNCPYGEGKTTCGICAVHCYRAAERERIRQVMRYAGPRMILRHPILAMRHLLTERRDRRLLKTQGG